MELIQINKEQVGGVVIDTVDARELHTRLQLGQDFSDWAKKKLAVTRSVENVDYVAVDTSNIAPPRKGRMDYKLSIRTALEFARRTEGGVARAVQVYLERHVPTTAVAVAPVAKKFTPPVHLANVKTMSSVEIVEVINQLRPTGKAELRHDDFMVKIRSHPGIEARNFSGYYVGGNGKTNPCYYLPKREAELMVMSESLEVQTKVYDRLTELEHQVANTTFKLPQTYAEALLELAANVQRTEALQLENAQKAVQIEQQTMLIETQKPSVEFVDKYVDGQELKPFRVVAKLLGANEREFRNFLVDNGYNRRLNGKWVHTDRYGPKGMKLFDMKTSVNAEGVTFEQSRFTAKGVVVISQRWNERKPVLTRKPPAIPTYTSYNT
jgi:phage antirepressor YoqD-like protein/phage anti-repressor protein